MTQFDPFRPRVRGENQPLKLAQGVEFWVYGGHARILINIKGSQAHSGPWVSIRLCDFKSLSADDLWVGLVVTELRACGSQVSEARAPWTFEHFADQGVELIEVDRTSQQKNIGDQRRLADLYGRLSRQ